MHIEKLQYITPDFQGEKFFHEVQAVIDSGIRWVQVRVKDMPEDKVIEIASRVVGMCAIAGARCIVNDNPRAALLSGADGVHLGKQDMPPREARKMMGDAMIIGGTANTIDDIVSLWQQGVDYIGLGPFRFTTTKKVLGPLLGLEGYRTIIAACAEQKIHTPIVAIGGIGIPDVQAIMSLGVHGIAVSGLIAQADNQKSVIETLYSMLP